MRTETAQMTFRDSLRKLLFEREISVAELSRQTHIPYQTLKTYTAKSGKVKRSPSYAHVIAVCRALGVTGDYFADCDDFRIEPKKKEDGAEDSGTQN